VKPATDDTQRLNVYADNWFALYLNGKRVAIEPIDVLPHNAQIGARLWQNVSCRRGSGDNLAAQFQRCGAKTAFILPIHHLRF
jgi:hypothetical protein